MTSTDWKHIDADVIYVSALDSKIHMKIPDVIGWRGRVVAMTPKQAKALRDRINVALLEIEPL